MAMTPDTLTQRGVSAVGPPSAPAFGSGGGWIGYGRVPSVAGQGCGRPGRASRGCWSA